MRRWHTRALVVGVTVCATIVAAGTAGAVHNTSPAATRAASVDKNGVLKVALDLPNAFGDDFDPGQPAQRLLVRGQLADLRHAWSRTAATPR